MMVKLNRTWSQTRRKMIMDLIVTLGLLSTIDLLKRANAQSELKTKKNNHSQLLSNPAWEEDRLDKEQIYQKFLELASEGVEDYPILLYQGIETSPLQQVIRNYPARLQQIPDERNLVAKTYPHSTFSPYPARGELPSIDEQGLKFLHKDIKEACVCIGSWASGSFQVKWLGRNALSSQEFWSGTKIIPMVYLVSLFNQKLPGVNIDRYKIRGLDREGKLRNIPVVNLFTELVSYEENLATSNSLGAMFKRFSTQLELEKWLKNLTGNQNLVFRGSYGEKPFLHRPELVDAATTNVILTAEEQLPARAGNRVSAYDLTRIISMVGWHNYLPQKSRLNWVSWPSLESVIFALGRDPARLTDLAIKQLGLESFLDSVVILSKLGNGASSLRERTEEVYVALVKLVMNNHVNPKQPPEMITFSMALRGAKASSPRELDREVVELDARMATEVTEILWRIVKGELSSSHA